MLRKRRHLIVTLLTLLIIILSSGIAIFIAKGYRFSPQNKIIFGTGILSIASVPEQASVYLDGHLTTATNANINSLEPRVYDVKIIKEGFIPWQKKVEVKQGLVSDIKATLFPSIPSVYPLTFTGAEKVTLSDDGLRVAYIVTGEDQTSGRLKKNGVWVWDMKERAIPFARGREPHQILSSSTLSLDLSNAKLKWSPDSNQLLLSLSDTEKGSFDREYLLDANKLNDDPRDINAIIKPTLSGWDDELKTSKISKLHTIKDLNLQKQASDSAVLKWSLDLKKILFQDSKLKFKVADLIENKTYDLPDSKGYFWIGDEKDSRYLVLVEDPGKVSVIEYDGGNKAIIYAGLFDLNSVFPWPDGSRVVILSSVPTPTASVPNLFGINLK